MSRAKEAFEQLARECREGVSPSKRPTWLELADLFDRAAKTVEDWEYEDRMGSDM